MDDALKALLLAHDADELVALLAYLEARNQESEGMQGVCCVVKNRHDLWRQSYPEVCVAPNQFECWDKEGAFAREIIKNWDIRLTSERALTMCYALAGVVIEGTLPSNVGLSTFYERWDRNSPWFVKEVKEGKIVPTVRIKDHVFYSERRFLKGG